MNCAKMKQRLLNQVLFLLSGVFLIALYQLTVSDGLYKRSLALKSGEDFIKASAEQLDKATVETQRLKESVIAPTAERHVVYQKNKTSFSLPTPTDSPQSPSLNQTVVHCTTVTREPPQETPTLASPSSEKAPHIKHEYPEDFFSVEDRRRGWMILHIIGVTYMFLSLLTVCDQFFVPALGVITDKLAVYDDVTGATFMAAGRSTPRLFAFLIGFSISHSTVGIGRIVGSAVFSILFVPGMCALLSCKVFHLTWWPLFRDMSFHILDLILIIIFFLDNVIMWWESLILVITYITYLIFMKFNVKIEQAFKIQQHRSKNNVEVSLEEARKEDVPACESSSRDAQNDEADGDEANSSCKHGNENNPEKQEEKHDKPLSLKWPETRCKQVAYLLLLPITIPMWLTVPDVRNKKYRKFFVITFLSSVLWINVFSYFFWWWAHQVCETIKVPHLFMTTVASPDLITSVIVARKGLGDMAMSSCVGSNIFDVTVGLPVPWLLYSTIHGLTPVAVSTDGLLCATMLLFLMLFFVIISIASCKCKMNKALGFTMFLLYIVFLVVAMMLQYGILVCPL